MHITEHATEWCKQNPICLPQVCRGTAVMMVSPTSGTEEIANPFGQEED